MNPFEDVLTDPTCRAREAKARGQRVIGTACVSVPLELIRAAGAFPLRIDSGSVEADQRAGEFPRDACPLTRACWGEYFAAAARPEVAGLLDAVVIPATCDWHYNLADRVRDRLPTMVLDVPRGKRVPGAIERWRGQVSELGRWLAERCGTAITREALAEAIGAYVAASQQVRRLVALMRGERPLVTGVAVLKALAALAWDDPAAWTAGAAAFADAAEAGPPQGPADPRCRVALLGSPPLWPHFVVPRLIEESGATIVAEESCGGARACYDTVYVDDPSLPGMTRAVADRYLLPCSCPCFVPNDDRLFRLRALVEDARPDGAVYYVLKSCYVYDAEFAAVRQVLEELGVRTLRVESDYSSESAEQLRTRLETFVDMLAGRV